MQIEGVDFFQTSAPVVQWMTVCSMMILATRLNLVSAQADITAAFVHAPLVLMSTFMSANLQVSNAMETLSSNSRSLFMVCASLPATFSITSLTISLPKA
jgi:hypothetical protein